MLKFTPKKFFVSLTTIAGITVIGIVFAAAPNPGHTWSEVGDVFVTVAQGGTGLSSMAAGGILYSPTTNTLSQLAPAAANYVLRSTAANMLEFAALIAADIPSLDVSKITTGIFGSARGGTGNGFTRFFGPTTSEKTFTLPNASATILTSNDTVTVGQGGTGTIPSGDDQILITSTATTAIWKTINDCQGAGKALTYTQSTNTIGCNTIAGGTHKLLDGVTHTDTLAGTVARGDLIVGNATPAWSRLAKGSANQVLKMDNTGTDIVWSTENKQDIYVVIGTDVASAKSNAYQNIANMSWPVAANTRYEVSCEIAYTASTKTIGIGIGWTGPAAPIVAFGSMTAGITQATLGGTVVQGNDTGYFTSASVWSSPTLNQASFHGTWSNGSNSGTLQMRFRPETATANGIIIKAGSWCKYTTF